MPGAAGQRDDIRKGNGGFTLIEVLVAVVILSICLLGMAQFFASAGDRVMDSETRSLLHQIATQEIEDIRALPYLEIGTQGGNPPGKIPDYEEKTVEGVPVAITREILLLKDPAYPDTGPSPGNYRSVTVTVQVLDSDELEPMKLSTIVAGGAEGGTLDITVTDTAGEPVPDALLKITNDNPFWNIDTYAIRTDYLGHLLVPGLDEDTEGDCYFVTASKTGYNDAATPTGRPVKKGTPFTEVCLIIDLLTNLTVHLTDGAGAPVADEVLMVTGTLSVPPWTFTELMSTDADGNASLTDLRYSTGLEPLIVQTSTAHSPALQLPLGVDPDPVDAGISLGEGQIGLIIDPGETRVVELELPPGP